MTEVQIGERIHEICSELSYMVTREGEEGVNEIERLAQQLIEMHHPEFTDQREEKRGQQLLKLQR